MNLKLNDYVANMIIACKLCNIHITKLVLPYYVSFTKVLSLV